MRFVLLLLLPVLRQRLQGQDPTMGVIALIIPRETVGIAKTIGKDGGAILLTSTFFLPWQQVYPARSCW